MTETKILRSVAVWQKAVNHAGRPNPSKHGHNKMDRDSDTVCLKFKINTPLKPH